MIVSDIVKRVQRAVGDDTEIQFEKLDIYRWINDAQVDIIRRTEVLMTTTEISSLAADGSYALPADCITVKRVTWDGLRLLGTTLANADRLYPAVDKGLSLDTPSTFYLAGRTLYLYPWPPSAIANVIDMMYVKMPTVIDSDDDVFEIPSYMHEDVFTYCMSRAKELDEEEDVAGKFREEYEGRIVDSMFEAQNVNSETYPAVRLCDGDDW